MAAMGSESVEAVRKRLRGLRVEGACWGYRPETVPATEPTALAALGFLATATEHQPASEQSEARAAADWLAAHQRSDGSLGVSTLLREPGWPTPYGILLWASLGAYPLQRQRALAWLLEQKGNTVETRGDGVVGHNARLVGWPWVPNTHSWLEPTALAVLALVREGLAEHPRTVEGLRLIRDRAIATGGWNYGNNVVFGQSLRPQPASTGLALMALAGTSDSPAIVDRAIGYLLEVLPQIRSAQSLTWGLLGLRAWNRCPEAAVDWLAEAAALALHRQHPAPSLAYLLLALGGR